MADLDDIGGPTATGPDCKRRKTAKLRPMELAKRVQVPERLGSPQLRTDCHGNRQVCRVAPVRRDPLATPIPCG
eukprot:4483073-Pyramimonas_sp.AAC.1